MATATLKAGSANPEITGKVSTVGDKEAVVVTVEGLYSDLEDADPGDYVPTDFTEESHTLVPDGTGMGKLTVNCVKYATASTFSAVRTTFRIDMVEVQYDLADHPRFTAAQRNIIKRWLEMDANIRTHEESGCDPTYRCYDENGNVVDIEDSDVEEFCETYLSGIKTFLRYYPIIEKISIYSNPPGVTASGRSFTSGSPDFSEGIGHYATPPLTLNGYPSTNWYKSKDSWTENADTTWNRVEQWTYTPESSSGDHAWIYEEESSSDE